jgi:hypothetical protein
MPPLSASRRTELQRSKIWVLKLILPLRYGRVLTGVLLLCVLLALFHLGAGDHGDENMPALFFSLIIAYIVPVFSFIIAQSQQAMRDLRPVLQLGEDEFEQALAKLGTATSREMVQCAAFGVVMCCAHLALIRGSVAEAIHYSVSSVSGALIFLGTLMVWVVMTTVIVVLIEHSIQFGRLGDHHTRLSLLDTRGLRPFARVSIITSLAVIGALALFPLIGLEGGQNLMESLPGAVAILGPLVVMFIIPVWPVHRRLVAMKGAHLSDLNARIASHVDASGALDPQAGNLATVLPLLHYRREIAQASTWPFDVGNLTTFAIYLIIPPLTWVGAALIENLVDVLING